MTDYDGLIARADVVSMNTEAVSNAMLEAIVDESAALSLFRRISVPDRVVRFPVISVLPVAYLVGSSQADGDTALKKSSTAEWDDKFMYIREWAVIIPIPDAVVEDSQFDIWGTVRPLAAGAIARKLDAAIFFGDDAPTEWGDDIATGATSAGNFYARGTNDASEGGLAEDINQLMMKVEADGYDVNGFVANRPFRGRLRGARDTTGQKLLDVTNETVEGVTVRYAMPGLWPSGQDVAELFAGDVTKGLVGVRRDFTFDLETTGIVQDESGAIIYNAFQQDLTLLRVTFRAGFVVANPLNRQEPTEANRYPFAVLNSITT
jgi:HK97 family phage major capsid protein